MLHPRSLEAVRGRRSIVSISIAATILVTGAGCGADRPSPTEPAAEEFDASEGRQGRHGRAIVVRTADELVAALAPENAGRRIVVRTGSYDVSQLLVVPDGATLEGEGIMRLDRSGRPTGFSAPTRTTIRMTANLPGNALSLGDGTTLRGLVVEDLPGRPGNAVGVVSRGAGDRVSATIAEVEILNPTAHGVGPLGPTGCGIAVVTQNPNLGGDPPPHAGARIAVRVRRTLVHSPAMGVGCGVFAFNFAPTAQLSVALVSNVVGGGIIASGGVSRPDLVIDSRTDIQSRGNVYRDDTPDACTAQRLGWNLQGGSGTPIPQPNPGATRNSLRVHSVDDRIEGFATGVLATGGRSFFAAPLHGPVSGNSLELQLHGTRISTVSCAGAPAGADLRLAGMLVSDGAIVPGDGNGARVVMRGVKGSGPRANAYAHVLGPNGPQPPALEGTGNRLTLVGSARAFAQTNRSIAPAPGAAFFTSRGW